MKEYNPTIFFTEKSKFGDDQGKNSTTFIAHDPQLDADFFIKMMPKKKFVGSDYFKEARIIYANQHPNIVEIQYAAADNSNPSGDDNIYFAMPIYKNGSLQTLMEKRSLTVREIIKYSLDFVSGVNYIHSRGLVHDDIKPSNILIDDTNRALLTDFGLAGELNPYGVLRQPLSTYIFTKAPETIRTNAKTIQSDIYQIGLTLYRMCNGPFILRNELDSFFDSITNPGIIDLKTRIAELQKIGDTIELPILLQELQKHYIRFLYQLVERNQFPDKNFFLPHIPSSLTRIIQKCIDVNPDKRYSNTLELMNALCSVNSNLDWKYSENCDKIVVERTTYKNIYSLEYNKKNEQLSTQKELIASKNKTRITKYCKTIKSSSLYKELSKIITELDGKD